MSQSRRAMVHPPVLSTEAHAATEAAWLGEVTSTDVPELPSDVTIPDSPATLWTSKSGSLFSVDTSSDVPTDLREWVAPPVVVRVRH